MYRLNLLPELVEGKRALISLALKRVNNYEKRIIHHPRHSQFEG